MKNPSKREYSSFEILRIFFLITLISFHWLHFWGKGINEYIDIRILYGFSTMSISGFAMITGFFAFGKKKMVSKNIYRLIYIIIFSIILGTITITALGQNIKDNYFNIFSGSRDSWYLYAILPIYGFCYISNASLTKMKWWVPLIMGVFIYACIFSLSYSAGWNSMSIGYIRNVLLLLSWALIGFGIRQLISSKKTLKFLNISFIFIFVLACLAKILLVVLISREATGKTTPDTILISGSLIYFASKKKYHNKIVNGISRYSYFAYEFHWLWQKVYSVLFSAFILKYPHLQFYVNWILIAAFSLVVSFILSFIQYKIWNKYFVLNFEKFVKKLWQKSKIRNV